MTAVFVITMFKKCHLVNGITVAVYARLYGYCVAGICRWKSDPAPQARIPHMLIYINKVACLISKILWHTGLHHFNIIQKDADFTQLFYKMCQHWKYKRGKINQSINRLH